MSAGSETRSAFGRLGGRRVARGGTGHFWRQRVSAIALVPLSIWFVWSGLSLVGANLAEVLVFLDETVNAILMLLFLVAALYHMTLGVETVIEDYIHGRSLKPVALMLNRLFALAVGLAAGFALFQIAF